MLEQKIHSLLYLHCFIDGILSSSFTEKIPVQSKPTITSPAELVTWFPTQLGPATKALYSKVSSAFGAKKGT